MSISLVGIFLYNSSVALTALVGRLSMFSFFSKKKPWASPGAMESWLKQLPRGDVMQAQQAIVELLDDYLKSDDYLQLDSLPALWILSENIESLLQQLLQHYLN